MDPPSEGQCLRPCITCLFVCLFASLFVCLFGEESVGQCLHPCITYLFVCLFGEEMDGHCLRPCITGLFVDLPLCVQKSPLYTLLPINQSIIQAMLSCGGGDVEHVPLSKPAIEVNMITVWSV